MRQVENKARKSYEKKISLEYYTSKDFLTATGFAAGNVALGMGARQVVGLVFMELWIAIRKELHVNITHDFESLLINVSQGVKQGLKTAREKYKDLFSQFCEGALSGIISSICTTISNIFFSTAKRAVKIIRESWASFIEALKILIINPDNLFFGEKIKAAAKVIAVGASIVAGTLLTELIAQISNEIPIVGDILPSFCSTFFSGILSCTFIYFLDHSELIKKIIDFLNSIPTIDNLVAFHKEQATKLEEFAAKLFEIDIVTFKKEINTYREAVSVLNKNMNNSELNITLFNIFKKLQLKQPWESSDHESFDDFMKDSSAELIF